MQKRFFIICFLISLLSCKLSDRKLIINLPDNFKGYGAIIFNGKQNCENEAETIIVMDSSRISYTSNCLVNNNVNENYTFKMNSGEKTIEIPFLYGSCEGIKSKDSLFHNGGYFISMNGFEILVFHIGKCNDPDKVFFRENPEVKQLEKDCREFTERLKVKSRSSY